jgi:hypothetical protein
MHNESRYIYIKQERIMTPVVTTIDGEAVKQNGVWVYVIGSPMLYNLVKVGIAINPKDRVKQHQTGNPYPLCLINAIGPFHKKRALEIEKLLLSENRVVQGEWIEAKFSVAGDLLNKFKISRG